MRRSKFLLLLLILVAACSERRRTPLIVSSYLEEKPWRTLAQSPNENVCLMESFTVGKLKEEVSRYEALYENERNGEGEFHGIDLATLKVPEANFLSTFGEEIGDLQDPGRTNYAGCTDLPCIFNRIYGEEGVAGYVHYLWYLKFGHMLALDNFVPKQSGDPGEFNGKALPLSSYLYSEDELYGLWRLTHMLEAPFTELKNLRQIQRVPRGEAFEETELKEACGLSSASGWIKLTDKCLSVKGDSGDLYLQLVHELSHQVDYEEGQLLYKLSHRSHKKDYLKLSGFSLLEYKREDGSVHREWVKKKVSSASDYGATNPQENFAEALAWFRIDGDSAREKLGPKHFNFVAEKYFGGKKFGKESLIQSWLQKLAPELHRRAIAAFVSCQGKEKCLPEVEEELRRKIQAREPEGCLVLSDEAGLSKWKAELGLRLEEFVSRHREELKRDETYLGKLQAISNEAGAEVATRAFLSCDSEECYQRLIKEEFSDFRLADVYQSLYPFAETKRKVLAGYRNLVRGKSYLLRKEGLKLWQQCGLTPDDSHVPTGEIFLLADGYLVSSIYNCLNAQLPDRIRGIVRKLQVQDAGEETLLLKEVRLALVNLLEETYRKERRKEARGCTPELPLYHLKKELTNPACSPPGTRP